MTITSDGPNSSASSNEDAIVRLVGPILLEQNDECAAQRARYVMLETIAP
jgi:putative transposase